MGKFAFQIEDRAGGTSLARAGKIMTEHGVIRTPAFIPVGTKATVKALTMDAVRSLGAQAVLSNTYHLYLEPGESVISEAGGLGRFMGWDGPTFTDSGGFQAFSLGAAFGRRVSKVAKGKDEPDEGGGVDRGELARVDDDGVTFKSHKDGSMHRFTPERSIEIQHAIGADIIVAFDECTSPKDGRERQEEALLRTRAWAERSLAAHQKLGGEQALYGVIQGGQFRELRERAAKDIGSMAFDGFAIGGSFTKEDIGTAVAWANAILPEDKPRHLLGIGEPIDLILGIESGVDTFDCVSPTRQGRNGALYTDEGRMNITNAKYVRDFTPIMADCDCYACTHTTRAYLAHLFRSDEMLAATLASIHNLRYLVRFVEKIRLSIVEGRYVAYRDALMRRLGSVQ